MIWNKRTKAGLLCNINHLNGSECWTIQRRDWSDRDVFLLMNIKDITME